MPEATRRISSPDREMFEGSGCTKQDVADYYRAVATPLLAGIAGRPLSVIRCPDGAEGACFFQKHGARRLGRNVEPVELPDASGSGEYFQVQGLAGVLDLVQMNAIEFHTWGATTRDPERPDRLVFDLDPGPGIDWDAIVGAAREVRDRLARQGLASGVRLTGGSGVHVVAPLASVHDWDTLRAFCRDFAEALAAEAPERYVATMAKAERKGRIFIDWLRNGRGATAVASWSLRARAGAPVAMPLRWDELGRVPASNHFSLARARRRHVRLRSDPWADLPLDQRLPE